MESDRQRKKVKINMRTFKTKKEAQDYAKKITPESYGTPTRKIRKVIKKNAKGNYTVYVYAERIRYGKGRR